MVARGRILDGMQPAPAPAPSWSFTPGQRVFLDVPRKAVIATLRIDGAVEQSIVYYIRDGDTLWISANPQGGKARDLRRDPRVSILVYADDASAYLAIEGVAVVSEDIETADRLQLMSRYLGPEGARQEIARKPKASPNARIRVLPARAMAFNIPEPVIAESSSSH